LKALLKSRLKAYQEVEVGGSSELLKQVEDGEGENCVLGRLEPEHDSKSLLLPAVISNEIFD
jgi:hypothetical protein